jgi:inhibitor of cysteine peptidase
MRAMVRKQRGRVRAVGLGLAIAFEVACAGSRALEADRAYQLGLASVDRIDVRVLTNRPASAHVNVFGTLPDTCTEIERSHQERFGSGIEVSLSTRRESRAGCEATPRPFERRILLDVVDLPAGVYSVDVNGVQGSFQITPDLEVQRLPVNMRRY